MGSPLCYVVTQKCLLTIYCVPSMAGDKTSRVCIHWVAILVGGDVGPGLLGGHNPYMHPGYVVVTI